MKRTLLIGLGNPLLRDDGIGIAVARELKRMLPEGEGPDIVELSVGGLRLMEAMVGYDRAIIVDAIRTGTQPVGTVSLLTIDDLNMPLHAVSSHDATLACALDTGRRMGLDLPEDIEFVAIEVADTNTFGETLSAEVAASLPFVLRTVISRIYNR